MTNVLSREFEISGLPKNKNKLIECFKTISSCYNEEMSNNNIKEYCKRLSMNKDECRELIFNFSTFSPSSNLYHHIRSAVSIITNKSIDMIDFKVTNCDENSLENILYEAIDELDFSEIKSLMSLVISNKKLQEYIKYHIICDFNVKLSCRYYVDSFFISRRISEDFYKTIINTLIDKLFDNSNTFYNKMLFVYEQAYITQQKLLATEKIASKNYNLSEDILANLIYLDTRFVKFYGQVDKIDTLVTFASKMRNINLDPSENKIKVDNKSNDILELKKEFVYADSFYIPKKIKTKFSEDNPLAHMCLSKEIQFLSQLPTADWWLLMNKDVLYTIVHTIHKNLNKCFDEMRNAVYSWSEIVDSNIKFFSLTLTNLKLACYEFIKKLNRLLTEERSEAENEFYMEKMNCFKECDNLIDKCIHILYNDYIIDQSWRNTISE